MTAKAVKAVKDRTQIIDLAASRCPAGYQIDGGWLRPRSRATASYQLEPGAYLRFANLTLTRQVHAGTFIDGPAGLEPQPGAALVFKPDNRAIFAFANSHGLLGADPDGEPVAAWRRAVGEMASVLYTIRDNVIECGEMIVGKDWARGERDKLRDTINRHLRGVTLQVTGDAPRFHKQIVARDLLAALWAQLVESLTTNHTFRACAACRRWMEVTPAGTGHRFNQRTCSVACRMTVHNRVKRAATAMRAEGRTLKQIAERLQSEHGWKSAAPTKQLKIWFAKEK